MSALLPLFPLQLVVFPRNSLPLHIFEERYKEMIGEAIRDRSEVGIVRASDDGVANTGCSVFVENVVTRYPDGRLDIVTEGYRRFEISSLDQERSFLRGTVDYFDDDLEDGPPRELRERAIERYRELAASGEPRAQSEPNCDDSQLSFQLAQAIPDLNFQDRLLRSRSETERLHSVCEFFEQYLPRVRYSVKMRQLAPRNGFGHKIAGV